MQTKKLWITVAATAALALGGTSVAVAGGNPFEDDQPLSGTELQQAGDAALAEVGPGTVTHAETSDDGDSAYEVDVRSDNGEEFDVDLDQSFQVVRVDGPDRDDDDSLPALSEADRTRAADAALAEAGAGIAADVERSDDGDSAYEVEVVLDDGAEVDVELGTDFQILRVDQPEYDD